MITKKRIFIVAAVILVITLIVGIQYYRTTVPRENLKYCQEYIAGTGNIKGDVDVEFWEALGPQFAIGANEEGYAVFKDPQAALQKIYDDYGDGIKELKKTVKGPLKDPFWRGYQYYALMSDGIDNKTKAQKHAHLIARFVDIYENSFREGGG